MNETQGITRHICRYCGMELHLGRLNWVTWVGSDGTGECTNAAGQITLHEPRR